VKERSSRSVSLLTPIPMNESIVLSSNLSERHCRTRHCHPRHSEPSTKT
jgi:hypothetical protein